MNNQCAPACMRSFVSFFLEQKAAGHGDQLAAEEHMTPLWSGDCLLATKRALQEISGFIE